jgi:O-methyltransferase involved in polyketide biosynthesis
MADRSKGRTAHGAAAVRAMESFVAPDQRLFEDDAALGLLSGLSRFLLRNAWFRTALQR